MSTVKKLYTISEIMEMVSVTRPTVHDWIKTDKLKAIKIGKEYRITDEHYQEFLGNNMVVNEIKKKRKNT